MPGPVLGSGDHNSRPFFPGALCPLGETDRFLDSDSSVWGRAEMGEPRGGGLTSWGVMEGSLEKGTLELRVEMRV